MRRVTLHKTLPMRVMVLDHEMGVIQPQDYKITYTLNALINPGAKNPLLEGQKAQNKSFSKINMLIEQILDNSILATADNTDTKMLEKYSNNFIILPDLTETTFIAALHCKFNHIINEGSAVNKVTLNETTEDVTYTYVIDNFDESTWIDLPNTDEWLTDLSCWENSWWFRPDISTFDRICEDQAEKDAWAIVKEEEGVDKANQEALTMIDDLYEDVFNENPEKLSGEIVDLTEFKDAKVKKQNSWKPRLV